MLVPSYVPYKLRRGDFVQPPVKSVSHYLDSAYPRTKTSLTKQLMHFRRVYVPDREMARW
jgi:hypothetical protein